MEKKILKGLVCTHNIAFTGSFGKPMRVVVLQSSSVHTVYVWITSAGQEFYEGDMYDITAEVDEKNILKRVRIQKDYSKLESETDPGWIKVESEQPDLNIKIKKTPVDVFDLIFDTDLTKD